MKRSTIMFIALCLTIIFFPGRALMSSNFDCEHANVVETWEWANDSDNTYTSIDDSIHSVLGEAKVYQYCSDCGMILSTPVTVYDFEITQRHTYYTTGENATCQYCDHVCGHSWTNEEEIWEDVTYEATEGDHYYHTKNGTRIRRWICGECGTFSSETVENAEDTERHSYVNQSADTVSHICAMCGHENSCEHENRYPSFTWKEGTVPISTEIEGDNAKHHVSGIATTYEYCGTCGVWLNVQENVSFTTEEWHSYDSEGVCGICGHINTCTHENQRDDSWIYDQGTARYVPVDNQEHTGTGTGTRYICCQDCGVMLEYEENAEITKTYGHAYSNSVCENCGHECMHEFDAEGYCSICGYVCSHPGVDEAAEQEKILSGQQVQYGDYNEDSHSVYGQCIITYKICPACGYEKEISRRYEQLQGTESHTYVNGGCECGAPCPHEGIEDTELHERVLTDPVCMRKDATHHVMAIVNQIYKVCPTCGQEVALSQTIAEEMEGTVGECSFDEYGWCSQCCSYCEHSEMIPVEDERVTEYTRINNEQHMGTVWASLHEECQYCGYHGEIYKQQVGETFTENHSDENGDGICDVCGKSITSNVEWEAVSLGVNRWRLVFRGAGEINDPERPWAVYAGGTEHIILGNDIDGIGPNAFEGFTGAGGNKLRIDFNQARMPSIDGTAFNGIEAVCRYYDSRYEETWTGESFGGTDIQWIYLPLNNQNNDLIHVHYIGNDLWRMNEETPVWRVVYMNGAQMREATWKNRWINIEEQLPTQEEMAAAMESAEEFTAISFWEGVSGEFVLNLPDNYPDASVWVTAPELTLTINPPDLYFMKLVMAAGNVTVNGSIFGELTLGDPASNVVDSSGSHTVINGDVERLTFRDRTIVDDYNNIRGYQGNLTVNGTIISGEQYGNMVRNVQGIGEVESGAGRLAVFENVMQQGEAAVTRGELSILDETHVTQTAMTEDITTKNHWYNYQYYGDDDWRLWLSPLSGEESFGIMIPKYIPGFSVDQIQWGENTGLGVYYHPGQTVVLNGAVDDNGNPIGLSRLDVADSGVEVNCPVGTIWIAKYDGLGNSGVVYAEINAPVGELNIDAETKDTAVYLGDTGSVGSGRWGRRLLNGRYFGAVSGPMTLYSNANLNVLSWAEGETTKAMMPSEETLISATDLTTGYTAQMDIRDKELNNLSNDETGALEDWLEEKGLTMNEVASLFDATVAVYSEDSNGNLVYNREVNELSEEVPVTVNNTAGGAAFIVRLHEQEAADGTSRIEATELAETQDSGNIEFYSDQFSTYAVVRNLTVNAWSEPEYIWNDGERTVTARRYQISDETVIETETVSFTYEILTSPTQTAAGQVHYTSGEFENEAFEQQSEDAEIPALSVMKTLVLPAGLIEIGEEAFVGLPVEAIVLPADCTQIADSTFDGCNALKYIRVLNPLLKRTVEAMFAGNGQVLID